ncbi:hypothetical protein N752_20380 [Desulforamulus aquiferis]|nr:hypothetical protein N752_20380 [Desulforamulus aquiferis]
MEECTDITSVVLVVGAGEEEYCQKNILGNSFSKIMAVVREAITAKLLFLMD